MPHFLLPLAESGTQNIRASSSQALALKLTGTASSPGSPACRWKPIPHGRSVCSSVHPSPYLSVLFLLRTLIQCLHVCRGVLTCIYCDPHPHPRIVHTLLSPTPTAPPSQPLLLLCQPPGHRAVVGMGSAPCSTQSLSCALSSGSGGPAHSPQRPSRRQEDIGAPVTFPQPSCTPAAGLAPTGSFPQGVSSPDPELCSPLLSGTSRCCHPLAEDTEVTWAPNSAGGEAACVLQCFRACLLGRRKEGAGKGSRAVV